MVFKNYSQTFASQITAGAGLVVALLGAFGVDFLGTQDVQFAIGAVVNFVGIVWTLVHRFRKGGVTALGKRTSS